MTLEVLSRSPCKRKGNIVKNSDSKRKGNDREKHYSQKKAKIIFRMFVNVLIMLVAQPKC